MRPLTPDEVDEAKTESIPDFVIGAVNNLLKKYGSSAEITQDEIIDEIMVQATPETTRREIFDKKWLDFEPVFRAVGWEVVYDKPGYNETYEPSFKFRRSK